MNEKLKITNDVEYITYTLRIPKYKIVDYKFAQSNAYLQSELIHQLQQENQQLKNDNAVMKAGLIQVSDKQRDLYKEVIEEVREYIKENRLYNYKYDEEELFEIITDKKEKEDLLQILDKAKENK